MTQNLRLVGPKTLTSENSDVTTSYNLPASSTSGWCTSGSSCRDVQNVIYTGNAVYGAWYSWKTATAGTGEYSSVATYLAPSSICPSGWRLPNGSQTYYTDIVNLTNAYGASTITSAPASFVKAGYMYGSSFHEEGSSGLLWSRGLWQTTPINIVITSDVAGESANQGFYGFNVRCVNI